MGVTTILHWDFPRQIIPLHLAIFARPVFPRTPKTSSLRRVILVDTSGWRDNDCKLPNLRRFSAESFMKPRTFWSPTSHIWAGGLKECLLARANLGDGTGDLLPHPEQKREGGLI